MKRTLLLLAAAAFFGQAALADTHYTIDFTGGSPAPTSGSFDYDPITGFSNFTVVWDGFSFDLTAAANAPFTSGTGCTGEASTSAYGFLIMSQAVSGCPNSAIYGWHADFESGGNLAIFEFHAQAGLPIIQNDAIHEIISFPSNFQPTAVSFGSWTITAQTPAAVPEPASILLAGSELTLLGIVAALRRRNRTRV